MKSMTWNCLSFQGGIVNYISQELTIAEVDSRDRSGTNASCEIPLALPSYVYAHNEVSIVQRLPKYERDISYLTEHA